MIGLHHIALLLIGLRFGECQRFFNIAGASQIQPGGSVRVTPTNNVLNIRPGSGIIRDNPDAPRVTSYKTATADDEERGTNRRILIDQYTPEPESKQNEEAPVTEEPELEDGGPESILRQLRKIRRNLLNQQLKDLNLVQ